MWWSGEGGKTMKYFTKEWKEEMGVSGFLAFHDRREDWEEEQAYCRDQGIDFQKNAREALEYRKSILLKHLPQSFHTYIHDGTINSEYPTTELRKMAEEWSRDFEERTKALWEDYRKHYQSIKNRLPENAIKLFEDTLHDSRLLSMERPSEDVLILNLDCRGGIHYFTDIRVTFVGVKEFHTTEVQEFGWWLYDEVYVSEKGFEYHVLLDNPLQEMRIVAADVSIEEI